MTKRIFVLFCVNIFYFGIRASTHAFEKKKQQRNQHEVFSHHDSIRCILLTWRVSFILIAIYRYCTPKEVNTNFMITSMFILIDLFFFFIALNKVVW